jgi:hypothetical protein
VTGYFVRAQHGGQWQSVEIDRLTDEELRVFLAGRPPEDLVQWVVGLVGWIRENVSEAPPVREERP